MEKKIDNQELKDIKGGMTEQTGSTNEMIKCSHCGRKISKSEFKSHRCLDVIVID